MTLRSSLTFALTIALTACSSSGSNSGSSDNSGPDGASGSGATAGAGGSMTTGGTAGASGGATGGDGAAIPDGSAAGGSSGSSGSGGSAGTDAGGTNTGGTAGTGGTMGTSGTTGGGAVCKGITSSVTAPLASGANVSVTVDVGSSSCALAPDFAGTNFESFPGWGADVSMSAFQQQACQDAGVQLFRYPGGEPAEWFDLLMTGQCADNSNANWGAPAYTSVWSFAQSAGVYSLMLQTNPTTQWCGSGSQDDSGMHAAAIASDAASHGVRSVFEIGNEPDIGGSYFAQNGGESAYIDKFIEQANAIHGAEPSAEVYGPVVCGLGGNCSFPVTWDSGWLDAFLARTGNKATGSGQGSVDGISFHVYWHNEWGFSDLAEANIDKYGFAVYWANTVMPYLRTIIAKYDTRDLPIAISEISVGNGVPNDPGQSQNMFTVLETLDTIGAFASSGLRSFQWFDANAEGPSDFWMITTNDTRPIYYSFVAWSKMGNQLLDVTSDANPHDVAVYATKKADGSVQILVINKTSSTHDVALTFNGFSAAGQALTAYTAEPATAGSDTATSVIYNGATDPLPSALPLPAVSTNGDAVPTYSVPAYSAVVLVFGP